MNTRDAVFRETTAEPRIRAVPLAHLSIELAQLDVDMFDAGPDRLRRHFRQVAPWVDAARRSHGARPVPASTCLLIDDYFTRFGTPVGVLPDVLLAARDSALEIDYVARMSGCVETDRVPVAALVEARLVADPPPGTNGSRPPTRETGWLSNGRRSPDHTIEAMSTAPAWQPPAENAARHHSIFMDIELWDEHGGQRSWSHAFLAGVWQLLRLGLVRHLGNDVCVPRTWEHELPDDWDALPHITQLNPAAAPFCAYRALSVLPTRLIPVAHAVRTILGQVAVEEPILAQVAARSRGEGIDLPPELVDRVDYAFVGGS